MCHERTRWAAAALLLALLGGAGACAYSQQAPQQSSQPTGQETGPQKPAKRDNSQPGKTQKQDGAQPTAQPGENSFPEDVSRKASQQGTETNPAEEPAKSTDAGPPSAPPASDAASAPDAPAPGGSGGDGQAKPPSAAQDNPFPEDVSREAAKSAADAGSGSGVSSSSSYGASSTDDPDVDRETDPDKATRRHKLPKPSDNVEVGSLSATARAKKDVEVGNYYLAAGSPKGAYARFADASKMDPTNVDAIFGLAEAARRLRRTDEAIANYKLFLAIAPDGSRAKEVRKGLNDLGAPK